jgi:hypothetical protein
MTNISTQAAQFGNWTKGTTADGHTFCIKHFDTGSIHGIDEGKISKLEIRKDREILANYDRGWDIEVADSATDAYNAILAAYN